MTTNQLYDLIIIGAGPAGYAASIYAARYNLKTLIFGKEPGGIAQTAPKIENWPGTKSISGMDLMALFKDHALAYKNVEIINQEVNDIKKENNYFQVHSQNKYYQAKTIILALGLIRRKLNIPGEAEFTGKGIAYCATCDAAFFKDKTVAVVGGANSAATSALLLAQFAKQVYIIYRGKELRADPAWIDKLKVNKKIKIMCCINVVKAEGQKFLEKITLDNKQELKVDGLFIEIGSIPSTALANQLKIKLNSKNFIQTDSGGKTNVSGVFAAGDITTGSNSLKQVVTASAEGAIAATSVYEYLKKE